MNQRQRRADIATANAVERGVNILQVRGSDLARHYMHLKGVPDAVIDRTLGSPALRRVPSPAQSISEALTPSPPDDT